MGGWVVGTDVVHGPAGRGDTASVEGSTDELHPRALPATMPRFSLYGVPAVVLAVGLLITAVLALTARSVHSGNENRLLHQRVNEAAAVVIGRDPEHPDAAVVGVDARRGDPRRSADVPGLHEDYAGDGRAVRLRVVVARRRDRSAAAGHGRQPDRAGEPTHGRDRGLPRPDERVEDGRGAGSARRAAAPARLRLQRRARPREYVVYAEAALPANRRAKVDTNSAFADLDYAIYLGPTRRHRAAARGERRRSATSGAGTRPTRVAFGDSQLHIVMTPRRELGGDLLARLPWLIGGIGTRCSRWLPRSSRNASCGAARDAEDARPTERARSSASSAAWRRRCNTASSRSTLPRVRRARSRGAVRPGVDGVDIGGDWYDVIGVDDGKVMLVVGDVSGRGLRAATVMAALRYAIRAYAARRRLARGHPRKLSKLIDVGGTATSRRYCAASWTSPSAASPSRTPGIRVRC